MTNTFVALGLCCIGALSGPPVRHVETVSFTNDITTPSQYFEPMTAVEIRDPSGARGDQSSDADQHLPATTLATIAGKDIVFTTAVLGNTPDDQALRQGTTYIEVRVKDQSARGAIDERKGKIQTWSGGTRIRTSLEGLSLQTDLQKRSLGDMRLVVSLRQRQWLSAGPRIGAVALKIDVLLERLIQDQDVAVAIPNSTVRIHLHLKRH